MSNPQPNICIPVDLTNPGQFFACCGLLELADRLWEGVEGWFRDDVFHVKAKTEGSLRDLLNSLSKCSVSNRMTDEQIRTHEILCSMSAKQLATLPGAEVQKSVLDGLKRKSPILLRGDFEFSIDWFCNPYTRGFALKTWAGQQSVLTLARNMHTGLRLAVSQGIDDPWCSLRDIGLPFMFDSEIGAQGSGRDVGFVFDKLEKNQHTKINRPCRPILELLCFIGLQRFLPYPMLQRDRHMFAVWELPLPISIAATVASTVVAIGASQIYVFNLVNRNKDYYSFYPARPYLGDTNGRNREV